MSQPTEQPPQSSFNFSSVVQPQPIPTVIGWDMFSVPNEAGGKIHGAVLVIQTPAGMNMYFLDEDGLDRTIQDSLAIKRKIATAKSGIITATPADLAKIDLNGFKH